MTMLVAEACYSLLVAVGLGVLIVGLFYRPGALHGPTNRIYRLFWAALLFAVVPFAFAQEAFGSKRISGYSITETRVVGVSMFVGYAIGGGGVAWRRRRRGRQSVVVPSRLDANAGSSPTAKRSLPAAVRVADYCFGVLFCWGALLAGTEVGPALRNWATHHGLRPEFVVLLMIQVVGLTYSQVVTASFTRALNTAVRLDWRAQRKRQFILAAGPFVAGLSIVVIAPSIAAGLLAQLIALFLGYTRTDGPPAGTLATLKRIYGAHGRYRGGHRQSKSLP
jgi:hypothetical protein